MWNYECTELTYDNIYSVYGDRVGNVLSRKTSFKFSTDEVNLQGILCSTNLYVWNAWWVSEITWSQVKWRSTYSRMRKVAHRLWFPSSAFKVSFYFLLCNFVCTFRTWGYVKRSRGPRCLRCESTVSQLLGLQDWIPPVAGMSVSCECCTLPGTVLCQGPITRSDGSYREGRGSCVCVIKYDQE